MTANKKTQPPRDQNQENQEFGHSKRGGHVTKTRKIKNLVTASVAAT